MDKERNSMEDYDCMQEARAYAAQCWCDETTKSIDMDVHLCEAVAKRIAWWMKEAARASRNKDYYRGLVVECGEAIGKESYIADNGTETEE